MSDLTRDGTTASAPAGVCVVTAKEEVDAVQDPGATHVVVGFSGIELALATLPDDDGVRDTGTVACMVLGGAPAHKL